MGGFSIAALLIKGLNVELGPKALNFSTQYITPFPGNGIRWNMSISWLFKNPERTTESSFKNKSQQKAEDEMIKAR